MPPRSSIRNRTATPARATRAATVATQNTPATRRSTRAASRQPTTIRDTVANPALPEIQLQQSYAYGSSKTPALPEQLQASQMSSMRAVASRLAEADAEAEQNFEARAAELKANTPDSQPSARDARAQKRATTEPVSIPPPAPSPTPDVVRKQDRVAAWVDSSQLDDVPEEDLMEEEIAASERERGESQPSSFPDGSFDHSYNYERGLRGPDLPLPEPEVEPDPEPERQRDDRTPVPVQKSSRIAPGQTQNTSTSIFSRTKSKTTEVLKHAGRSIQAMLSAFWFWLTRMVQMMQKSISELPDAPITSALFKTFLLSAVLCVAGISFCALFTYTCNPGSTSIISQSLQRVCGQCAASNVPEAGWNFTMADPNDLNGLLSALQQTQNHILKVETRLSSRIDSSHASHVASIAALRSHQEILESQIRRLKSQNAPKHKQSSHAISSPLIADKINFFSVSSGAAVIPELTSPTRSSKGSSFFGNIGKRMLGLHSPNVLPAVSALEPWVDEGDCWCAAADHSLYLGIQLPQSVYATELVIEHFPSKSSLTPGNTPREIELWADFRGLTAQEWTKLHVEDLIMQSGTPPIGTSKGSVQQTWARIGNAVYAISSARSQKSSVYEMAADDTYGIHSHHEPDEDGSEAEVSHVQRFNLQINQHGLLHYTNRFLLRVTSNHGADHTCLYRVRLHGLPLENETQGVST